VDALGSSECSGPLLLPFAGARAATDGAAPGCACAGATGAPLAAQANALWELFLGVYCTIWGFKRDAPILSESARMT